MVHSKNEYVHYHDHYYPQIPRIDIFQISIENLIDYELWVQIEIYLYNKSIDVYHSKRKLYI
jgi:hypothetical protein